MQLYQPLLLEKDRNDAETLEDNICVEIEVVDHETNIKADEKAINYVSGNELCWDIGEAVDKKKTIIIQPAFSAVDKTFDVKISSINRNFVKDLESDGSNRRNNVYNLEYTNKMLMGDASGKFLMAFKVKKKTYHLKNKK